MALPGDEPVEGTGAAPEFLSEAWLATFEAALRASPALHDLDEDVVLVIEEVVTQVPPGAGTTRYSIELRRGEAHVRPGPAAAPALTFTQTHEVASALHEGRISAQEAFAAGGLKVSGDVQGAVAQVELVTALAQAMAAPRSARVE